MIHTRRFLGAAAAGAVGIGLLLPMEAAHAEGACTFTTLGTTISTSTDCTLSATETIPAGFTFDGNGHTITATGSAWTGGAIFASTPGTSGNPATLMTIGHVTIDASGASGANVIEFDGSKGRVNQVNITGGQPYGVEITNTVGATFATTDQVKIDGGSSIKGYEQAAVHVTDSMRFTVLRSTIGNPSTAAGNGAAGILAEDGAHGAVTENHISLSHASSASQSAFRAGVKISETTRVEVKRNVFSGSDADFGVSVTNPAQANRTTAAVDCNLFRVIGAASAPYGVAVGQWENQQKTNVQLTNSTFVGGWNHHSGTVTGTSVGAGPVNAVHHRPTNVKCSPATPPTHVVAAGGDRRSKVTWHAATARDWAPITGYQVKAKAPGQAAITKSVAANATAATLTGLKNKLTYTITVSAVTNGLSAAGTDKLYSTKLSLSGPKAIRHGTRAHLGGKLSSSDRNAKLSKRKLQLWAKPKGGKWSKIGTIKTKGGGHFDTTVKPRKKTTYKVVYGGHPGLASSHKFTVAVH